MTGIQDRDGVLLDRAGNPVSPYIGGGKQKLTMADVVPMAEQPPPPPVPPVVRWVCNETTLRRDLDAYTLARLLNIATGGMLEISLTPDEFGRLSGDVRDNFRPIRSDVA